MNALAAEYQDIFKLYLRLSQDLAGIMDENNSQNPQQLIESVLRNCDSLARIEQMNSRILQLSDAFNKCRDDLDPKSREEIRNLAQAAKAQAIRLKELCGMHAQKIQATRDRLGTRMAEIGKGAQFLDSIKPIKNNYPKFIDSLY
jgi:archaellum component FlaC